MNLLVALVIIIGASYCKAECRMFPDELKVQYLRNPLAVDSPNPRLSWRLTQYPIDENPENNLTQTAYQILAATQREMLRDKPDLWDSGKVKSNLQIGIKYEGKLPGPGKRIFWTVRVWDQNDELCLYYTGDFWDNAYNASHWSAHWISAPQQLQKQALNNISDTDKNVISTHNGLKPAVYFRKKFSLDGNIKLAKAYTTAKGMYNLFMNDESGLKISFDKPLFTPGWTDYNKSLQYQVYDVTDILRKNNTIGVILGTGWYSGYIGWESKYGFYGNREAFLLELHIEFKNGSELVIGSDNTWKVTTGPVIYSDLYQGELYYEDRSLNGWLNYDFDDSKWSAVNSVIIDKNVQLVADQSDPIVELDYYRALRAWQSSPGVWVYDFGINMAGYVRITLRNFTSDARIQVRHAEVLNPNGTIYTLNLRAARATDTYLLNG